MNKLKKFAQNAKNGLYEHKNIENAVTTCIWNTPGVRAALNFFHVVPKIEISESEELFPTERNFACWELNTLYDLHWHVGKLFFHPRLNDCELRRIFGIACHEMGHLLSFENLESLLEQYSELDEEQVADKLFEDATGLEIWYDQDLVQWLIIPPDGGPEGYIRQRPKGLK